MIEHTLHHDGLLEQIIERYIDGKTEKKDQN